jgi:hypothetical protein
MRPEIVLAAQRKSVFGATLAYAQLGMSVIPLHGKLPPVIASTGKPMKWTQYQTLRATAAKIRGWHEYGLLENVGIVCGSVSRNLVVIDLDGLDAVAAFDAEFPQYRKTYSVASGSGKGRHVYLYVTNLPHTTRAVGTPVGNIELRADGCYVVAPPSVHPTSKTPYEVCDAHSIAHVPDLAQLVNWITSLVLAKRQTVNVGDVQPTIRSGDAWAHRALDNEAQAVQLAAHGNRNNRLNLAAFKCGQLVALGRLTAYEVERTLLAAALAVGLPEKESAATIDSGLTAGMTKPIYRRLS